MQIKHRYSGKVLFDAESETQKELLAKAVSEGANLKYANLKYANLEGANLKGAKTKLFIIPGTRHELQANIHSCKVGCVCRTWDWWTDENIEKLGNHHDYTPEQIAEYKEYIEFCRSRVQWDVTKFNEES